MSEPQRIDDYAAIGDGRSVALVSREGSVDWLCWPRFDSPALFAAILDRSRGGHWQIAPTGPARVSRRYATDTNVLETRFRTSTGTVLLTDLMSIDDDPPGLMPGHELLRRVECEDGRVELAVHFEPRPCYGKQAADLHDGGPLGLRLALGSRLMTLRSDMLLERRGPGLYTGRLSLDEGEVLDFSLTWDDECPAVLPMLRLAHERIARTEQSWRRWAARSTYRGPYREAVMRSALAMKLLSFAPSGAVVAAATTSLPERVGGDLNWDYRFCWLRDAAFTTRALFELGYEEDALSFGGWLLHATRLTLPEVSVLYDVYGRVPRAEVDLSHLEGYRGSRPVRVRNGATHQLQLDTYGEVIDALFQVYSDGEPIDRQTQTLLRRLGAFVADHWHLPDKGIWEIRGPPRHHTHSRVLCWTALDRLIQLGERGQLPRIAINSLRTERDRILEDVVAHGYAERARSYTQTFGGQSVDAALLLLPWYGFEHAQTARMQHTWERIRQRLEAGPGLFYRYEESRRVEEGAFGICSFWVAEFLARGGGTYEEAREQFEQTLGYANDLGLFAEEIDPVTGEALGNFPQAYTHVGLISAALALEEHRPAVLLEPSPMEAAW